MPTMRRRLAIWIGLLIVALAILFGDHIIGRLYFQYLCSTTTGITINKTVDRVDGFMWPAQADAPYNDAKTGYVFIEGAVKDGLVTRAIVGSNGETSIQRRVKPQSQYVLEYESISLPLHVTRGEYAVIERATGDKLAKRVSYAHEGGWLFRVQAPLGYKGPSCPSTPFSPRSELVSVVLKPVNWGVSSRAYNSTTSRACSTLPSKLRNICRL